MSSFIITVLSQVPGWVWAILALIVVMGLLQGRDQRITRARLLILPLVWLVFGAWGVASAFGLGVAGASGLGAAPLLAWGLGLGAGLLLVQRSGWPGQASFDPASRRFFVPGSWLPLALMLAIFVVKFALGVGLAIKPQLAHSLPAAAGFSLLFGALGGVFLGRSRNILGRAATQSRHDFSAPHAIQQH